MFSFGQYISCESGYHYTHVYIRLEELASPYYIWKNKGYIVTVASIKGGEIPLDPLSLKDDYLTEHSKTFLNSGKQIGQSYSSSCSFSYRVCFPAFRIFSRKSWTDDERMHACRGRDEGAEELPLSLISEHGRVRCTVHPRQVSMK